MQLHVDFGERGYQIHIEAGGPDGVVEPFLAQFGRADVALFTDENVGPLYADATLERFRGAGCRAEQFTFGVGESHKVMTSADRAWQWMLEQGFDRRVVVVALGGGIVGDLAGFVASTWMRGVRLVAVPTTLLSQVDSSVGGKTGFNVLGRKNIVGTFHQPSLVYSALGSLKTLEPREFRSGLAEVVKHGVIGRMAIIEQIEHEAAAISEQSEAAMMRLISACCEVKRQVVEADERESGRRAVLNFGHTFGHAIETVSRHELRHGEAVALGMVAECRLSEQLGFCSSAIGARLAALLENIGLDADHRPWWTAEVATAMRADKKRQGTAINIAVVRDIEQVEIHRLDGADLERMVSAST